MKQLDALVVAGNTEFEQFGNVSTRISGDLILFSYTHAAQFEAKWNWFERISRGLIMNRKTGEVVAKPFEKFFNWFERGRKTRAALIETTEKMDGSLGILYRDNGYKIATRGSFDGEQALWATDYLNRNYDLSNLPEDLTLLFEIIYPENRVVVDYGKREDLVLIGVINRFTNEDWLMFPDMYELANEFGFTLPRFYNFNDVTTIMEEAEKIDYNEEGWVLRFADGQRFKIKGDRYTEIHKLISTLSFKNLVKAMQNNELDEYLKLIPDEFLDEVKEWKQEIENERDRIAIEINLAFINLPKTNRKEFAIAVQKKHGRLASYLFRKYDNRDYLELIYKEINENHKQLF
jgi:RNA ligase